MSERLPFPTKEWRNLSTRISPDIEAGLDLAGIIDSLSTKQQRLLSLPKDFRVHKVQHNIQLLHTVIGLGLYGELDRIVAGLSPLQEIPVEDYLIADYSTLGSAIDAAYFYCVRAQRHDLVETLQPMRDITERYYPTTYLIEGYSFEGLLDLSDEEIEGYRHWTEKEWIRMYIGATSIRGKAYLLGGSQEYPQDWLLHEVERYAKKVFSTPGYEPFNDHPYGTENS